MADHATDSPAAAAPAADRDVFDDTGGLRRGDVLVRFIALGEGLSGDYDPSDADDVEMLRFDVLARDPATGPELMPVADASYCTHVPASTGEPVRRDLLRALMDIVYGRVVAGKSIKKQCEAASWMTAARMPFVFNGNYRDLEQVARYLPAFTALKAKGMSYNDEFRGHIPQLLPEGWASTLGTSHCGDQEDTAIYLLQGLYSQRAMRARVEEALAAGYEHIYRVVDRYGPNPGDRRGTVRARERLACVVFVDVHRGSSWREWTDARLVGDATGDVASVLPKGQRIHGYARGLCRCLVKRRA